MVSAAQLQQAFTPYLGRTTHPTFRDNFTGRLGGHFGHGRWPNKWVRYSETPPTDGPTSREDADRNGWFKAPCVILYLGNPLGYGISSPYDLKFIKWLQQYWNKHHTFPNMYISEDYNEGPPFVFYPGQRVPNFRLSNDNRRIYECFQLYDFGGAAAPCLVPKVYNGVNSLDSADLSHPFSSETPVWRKTLFELTSDMNETDLFFGFWCNPFHLQGPPRPDGTMNQSPDISGLEDLREIASFFQPLFFNKMQGDDWNNGTENGLLYCYVRSDGKISKAPLTAVEIAIPPLDENGAARTKSLVAGKFHEKGRSVITKLVWQIWLKSSDNYVPFGIPRPTVWDKFRGQRTGADMWDKERLLALKPSQRLEVNPETTQEWEEFFSLPLSEGDVWDDHLSEVVPSDRKDNRSSDSEDDELSQDLFAGVNEPSLFLSAAGARPNPWTGHPTRRGDRAPSPDLFAGVNEPSLFLSERTPHRHAWGRTPRHHAWERAASPGRYRGRGGRRQPRRYTKSKRRTRFKKSTKPKRNPKRNPKRKSKRLNKSKRKYKKSSKKIT